MEIVSIFLMAPFLAAWAIISASWWIGLLFSGFFLSSVYNVHEKDVEEHFNAFFLFAIGILLSVFFGQYFGTPHSFWDATKQTFSIFASGLGYYAAWGLLSVLVLWILEAMKFRRKYKQARELYRELRAEQHNRSVESDDLWHQSLRKVRLRDDTPLDAKSGQGIALLSSFFFLWPVHLVDRIFGELVRQIPELLSIVFGGFLNILSRVITGGTRGRPQD
jgi:hypothetical protein